VIEAVVFDLDGVFEINVHEYTYFLEADAV
jgi:hypothetical protein